MIGQVTVVVVAAADGGQEAAQAGPGGTAATEEWWPGWPKRTHVSAKSLHILCEEDAVLLGIIPECIKTLSKGEHRVL